MRSNVTVFISFLSIQINLRYNIIAMKIKMRTFEDIKKKKIYTFKLNVLQVVLKF